MPGITSPGPRKQARNDSSSKPYTAETLLEVVREVLDQQDPTTERQGRGRQDGQDPCLSIKAMDQKRAWKWVLAMHEALDPRSSTGLPPAGASCRNGTPGPPARISRIFRELGLPAGQRRAASAGTQPEATRAELLVIGQNPDGREVRLAPSAAAAWEQMGAAAARNAGIALLPLSGFRSMARQEEIIQDKLSAGQSLADILRLVAAPGYSEHHTGRALDIGAPDEPPLEEGFAQTAAFALAHATGRRVRIQTFLSAQQSPRHRHGPWHWCWHG